MESTEIKIGHWYLLNFGFEKVKGKAIEVMDNIILFKFYWGDFLIRSKQIVNITEVICECKRPGLFSNK